MPERTDHHEEYSGDVPMNIKSLAAGGAAGSLLCALAVAASPSAAAAACGHWSPGGGKIIQSCDLSANVYTATALFSFSQDEINAWRCTGSTYMEVDMIAYGVPAAGGNKTYASNLPNTYLDVDYEDGVRTMTVGTTAAQNMVANREYYTTVHLRNFTVARDRSQLALTFQRSHWARWSSPKERVSCESHGGSDPAWCVFPTKSHAMQGELGVASYVDMRLPFTSTISTTWGRYRTSQLTPVNQMVPGDKIFSPNGLNYLLMQSDGNLVVYIPEPRAVWASNTMGNPGSVFVAQGDGNYVVYGPGNRPTWASGTSGSGTTLRLQDDRNLVVYAPGNRAIWSNNIAGQP